MTPVEVLDFLTSRGVEVIRETWSSRSCIVSTRIAVEVLRALGAPAYPQAVAVDLANAAAIRALDEGWADDKARVFREGAKWVAIEGTGHLDAVTKEWDGHLVACHPGPEGSTVLVDLTLDQASRPLYGLIAVPWWTIVTSWPAAFVDESGSVLRYQRLDVRSYRHARDWTDEARWRPVVDQLLAELTSSRLDVVPGGE